MKRLLLFFSLTSAVFAGEVHLFILSGQSNMAGLKPEKAFLPELKKLLSNDDIQHVKFAKGGQPIRKWVKTFDEISAKNKLPAKNDPGAFYDQTLKAARASILAKKPKTITFLWMQGERDAKEKLSAAYEESMNTLIANLRKDLDTPNMNFVIGRLSDFSTSDHWEAVRAAQVKVAKDDPRGSWVDTDDTNNKEKQGNPHNDLHYTKEGYDLFGRRLARQAVLLIKGEEPDPKGQP
ncbi:MAG: sialate O-acetylesterase [Akkermansiaceae bacterium]|nr:sialate O-acetylesterase [Akkermansiaceae bacterium]